MHTGTMRVVALCLHNIAFPHRAQASSSGEGELCGWPSLSTPVKVAPEAGAVGRKVETSLCVVWAFEEFLRSDLNES